ncbi:general stress protein [Agromyces sp. LHK192]|uniref:general stress protein n=1 Tax=Agromyces sp. LHK192 TaxID=2498704 RepID=UPI00196A8471|nr:general stress protein [Agromyces sp. LHK192]
MTTPSPFGRRAAAQFPSMPKGETVASFETYQEAQAAVDRLAKAEFPVKELSIVGTDLTSVERITGKLTWGRAAGAGALSGAWFGLFLGLLFFIFSPTGAGLGLLASAVLIGAGFGVTFGLVSYSVNRRRRDFTSVMQVLATRYAVIAEPAHVDRAREVLGVEAPIARAAGAAAAGTTASPAAPADPPRTYGEMTDAARRGGASAPATSAPATAPDSPVGESAEPAADAPVEASDAPQIDPDRPLTYGEAQDAARRAARERDRADRGQREP